MPVGITIAALAVLFGAKGGGGPSHFLTDAETQIKSVVSDKTRRKAILDEIGDLSKKLRVLEKKIEAHLKDYAAVHSDFHASETDFDAVSANFSADQQEVAKLILDTRETMREQMTREEWNAVFQSLENEK
ncbi:hypothetical protein P4B35_02875 [Pontiellaceae bacterium B12227]|nr:hypothetical protein [Pontiellaceae bacterium B12227]